MEPNEAVAQTPGTLALGGRAFVILPPTPRDMLAASRRMRAMVEAKALSPLDYVASRREHIPAAVFALAVAESIKLGALPQVAPDPALVWEQYATLEGVRWRVWYHVSRLDKSVTPDRVAEWVTEDNLFDVAEQLDAALGLAGIDPKKKAPEATTGANS